MFVCAKVIEQLELGQKMISDKIGAQQQRLFSYLTSSSMIKLISFNFKAICKRRGMV